jgi:putative drug exporter of the RND superfamily
VAGCTVAVSVPGLYISGVGFVGALGLAAALVVVVTMICALTLVPAFMGLVRQGVRALTARARARKEGLSAQQQAAQTAAATHEQHEHSAFARWGPDGVRPSLAVGGGQRRGAGRAGHPAVVDHAGPAG